MKLIINKYLIISSLFVILVILVYNRHINIPDYDWRCELFADQSGYYVYLPGTFLYKLNGKLFPEDIINKTGLGFRFDSTGTKFITKYTYGIALLQAPFFFIIHSLVKIAHLPPDGFSHLYQEIPNLAVIFYTLISFIFIFKFLRFYFSRNISLISISTIFIGTNWYYYSIDSSGMSHSYTACLISILFYLAKHISIHHNELKKSNSKIILLFLLSGLIVLIRPINILVIPVIYFICNPYENIGSCFSQLINKLNTFRIITCLITILIIWLPQLFYWKYAYGSYFSYSYGEEGFTNKWNPKFFQLWFAPENGLILYSPLYIMLIVSMIILILKKSHTGIISFIFFLAISYTSASWHAVSFGCSFGQRNYVDFAPLWCFIFCFLLSNIGLYKKIYKGIFALIIGLFAFVNIFLANSYNKCFFSTTWDYSEYAYYYSKHWHKVDTVKPEEETILQNNEFTRVFTYPKNSNFYKLKFANVSFQLLHISDTINSLVRFELLKEGQIIFSADNELKSITENSSLWKDYNFTFEFPKNDHKEEEYRLVFCNPSLKDSYKVKMIKINSY